MPPSSSSNILTIIQREASAYRAFQAILSQLLLGHAFTAHHADLFLRKYDPSKNYHHPAWRASKVVRTSYDTNATATSPADATHLEVQLLVLALTVQSRELRCQPFLVDRILQCFRSQEQPLRFDEKVEEESPSEEAEK